ncbi:replication protein C, IncQ-type [Thiomonas sp. FB-Cd]|uniref:replication protein C, IncQ-type n=1 Tax=Thiomonas sp. FB-Cd TaxID=1158292 RepID=UPI0018CC626C|nr:replication protein C, IncQ-type [Thiomonas sp. FB-Cd]
MAFGLAGMVRPTIRAERNQHGKLVSSRRYLDGVKQKWNGGEISLSGPELDAFDLRVLLACQSLALQSAHNAKYLDDRLENGVDVKGLLAAPRKAGDANMADELPTFSLTTTMSAVSEAIGRKPRDGQAHAAIRASLQRLASIVVTATKGNKGAFTHLIAGGAFYGRHAVRLTLSYRLTQALLGEGSYGRIHMSEFIKLTPVGQIVYHWLSCWRPGAGAPRTIKLDRLAEHVWGGAAEDHKTRTDRRRQLTKALASMPSAEWQIQIDGELASVARKNGAAKTRANACS